MRRRSMSKRTKIILAMDIAIGIALAVIGVAVPVDYYSTLLFSMGFALVLGSVWQLVKDYHHTRPENAEAYREKSASRKLI